MEIRGFAPEDTASVRRIARASLEASYADVLSRDTIDQAIEEWYTDEAFEEYLDGDEMVFLVAVEAGEIVGFSQSHLLKEEGKGRVLWLHIDPEHRGEGIGSTLFERTRDELRNRGIERVTGVVLTDNEEGNQFYRRQGLESLYTRTVTIGGEEYQETIYGEPGAELDELERLETPDGEAVFVDRKESTRGASGPFHDVYLDPDRSRRYGWFCSACESVDTAMDSMGRIQCNQCGNHRKPTRWDAGYL